MALRALELAEHWLARILVQLEYGGFYKLGVLFVGVLKSSTIWVQNEAPDFLEILIRSRPPFLVRAPVALTSSLSFGAYRFFKPPPASMKDHKTEVRPMVPFLPEPRLCGASGVGISPFIQSMLILLVAPKGLRVELLLILMLQALNPYVDQSFFSMTQRRGTPRVSRPSI